MFIQANRTSILSHITQRTNEDPQGILGSITAGVPHAHVRRLARDHNLVSWVGTSDEKDCGPSICLLHTQIQVRTRDQAMNFSSEHERDDYPTLDNAQEWVKYGAALAELVDSLSHQDTERFGTEFVPAPRPPTEVQIQDDLVKLNKVIDDLTSRVEDVMFVVSAISPMTRFC